MKPFFQGVIGGFIGLILAGIVIAGFLIQNRLMTNIVHEEVKEECLK